MERYHVNKRNDDYNGQRLFIQNFNFNGSELNFKFKEVVTPPVLKEGVVSENYWEHPENKEEAFKIDVYEMDSFEAATKLLETILSSHMMPKVPEWESDIKPGEVAFGSGSHVVFTRGNLVIIINSIGQKDIDVSPHAKQLDLLFTYLPDLPVVEDRSSFSSFAISRDEKGNMLINIDGQQAMVRQGVWFKFITERGSLQRLKTGQLEVPQETSSAGVMMYAFIGSRPLERRRFKM